LILKDEAIVSSCIFCSFPIDTCHYQVSLGSLNTSIVEPREVFCRNNRNFLCRTPKERCLHIGLKGGISHEPSLADNENKEIVAASTYMYKKCKEI